MRRRRPAGHFHEFLRLRIKRGDRRAIAGLLGISEGNFGSWLRRGSEPGIYAAQKIADHYGVSLDYLVTGEDYMAGKDPRVVEICRQLLRLENDEEFLRIVSGIVRQRLSEKEAAASTKDDTEEERARSATRG